MNRHHCDQCRNEIDSNDFYMISRSGKICSDCLMVAGPIETGSAYLFRRGNPKKEQPKTRNVGSRPIVLEEAL